MHWIVDHMAKSWGDGASWQQGLGVNPHESNYLKLDISKAKVRLDWSPRWTLEKALAACVDWHRQNLTGADMRAVTLSQINQYTREY